MLYNSFRAVMIFTSLLGILNMIATSSYLYILFPLSIIVWGIFSFFDENDKEYVRRNGMNDTSYGSNHYYSPYAPKTHSYYYPTRTNKTYNDLRYDALISKIKKNKMVSLPKETN